MECTCDAIEKNGTAQHAQFGNSPKSSSLCAAREAYEVEPRNSFLSRAATTQPSSDVNLRARPKSITTQPPALHSRLRWEIVSYCTILMAIPAILANFGTARATSSLTFCRSGVARCDCEIGRLDVTVDVSQLVHASNSIQHMLPDMAHDGLIPAASRCTAAPRVRHVHPQ